LQFASHHTDKFKQAYLRVLKVAEAQGPAAAKVAFRDEMIQLGHLERVRNLYRVKNKLTRKAVFFVPNGPQETYLQTKKGSDIILKPRQIGFTTLSCVRGLDLALWEPNMSTGIMAHEQNKVQTIFTDSVKFTYQTFKRDWGQLYAPTESADSSSALSFKDDGLGSPLNSSMRVLYDFRGKTVHFLHVSEAARVEDDRLLGSLNGVPDNGEIILESTAAGMGGEYYRLWQLFKKERSLAPYKGHFTPWFEFYPEELSEWNWPDNAPLSDYEKQLVEDSNGAVTKAHLAWRRYKIEKSCQGDSERFENEYPTNDTDCFYTGDSLVFPTSVLKNQASYTRPPAKSCFLLSDGKGGIKVHDDAKGVFQLWELPDPTCQYAIGADPSGGVGKDNGAAYVLNRKNGKFVAALVGQLDPAEFAKELWKLATYYNKAFINPECNNHGHAVIEVLKTLGYRNFYKRRVIDEVTAKPTSKIGFLTTNESKLLLTEKFKAACKEGKVVIYDHALVSEMSTFVQVSSKTGRTVKREAIAGAKDDRVMAACLTWEMHSSLGSSEGHEEADASAELYEGADLADETHFAF
jgi:hypothetical protein